MGKKQIGCDKVQFAVLRYMFIDVLCMTDKYNIRLIKKNLHVNISCVMLTEVICQVKFIF